MYVINLFGAPGSGKSTAASGLFNKMKTDGYNVEYVTEFAKDLVYESNWEVLNNQFYVSANQDHRIRRLIGKVDYVVTDSPVLQGLCYTKGVFNSKEFENFLLYVHNSYNNINFVIERNHSYRREGRMQNTDESDQIHLNMMEILTYKDINYTYMENNDHLKIYSNLKNRKVL